MNNNTYEITKRGEMPDGTKIQVENWEPVYPGLSEPFYCVAYPISKANCTGCFAPKTGEKFRAAFSFPTLKAAETVFNALKTGTAQLENYIEYIDNYMHIPAITGRK